MRSFLGILASLLLVGGSAATGHGAGSSIAIDFGAYPPLDGAYSSWPERPSQMSPLETAGVVPQIYWNSFIGRTNDVPASLAFDTGDPSDALVTWQCSYMFATQGSDLEGNPRMMFGGLAAPEGSTTTITINGLPASFAAAGYDVIVYYDTNNDRFTDSIGSYSIAGQTLYGRDAAASSFTGLFVQGQTTTAPAPFATEDPSAASMVPAGNFLRFEHLSTDSFTLTATSVVDSAAVNGI